MRAARNGANKGSPDLPLARTGGRQRPGPPRHDPTRLALSDVSEGERARIVVSRPHADSRIGTRKTIIPAFARTALARKLAIALWRFVTTGEPLEGVILRPAGRSPGT